MKEPTSLDDNVIYLIGEIARLAHKRVTSIFIEKQFDVTVEQFGVLAVLWYEDGVNQQTMAERLNRDKTTITRIVQKMIKKSLIVRIPDQLDRRNKLIYLTEKGRSLQTEMINSTSIVYIDALKNITAPEIDSLIKILVKMKTNLNS